MSSDLSLEPIGIVRIYGLRFKIEFEFKQAAHVIGSFHYHVLLFMGVVTQGLMHYLASCHTNLVWKTFGSWLCTIRQGFAPSE